MKGIFGNLFQGQRRPTGSAARTAYIRTLQVEFEDVGKALRGFSNLFETAAEVAGERAVQVKALADAIPAEATAEDVERAAAEIAATFQPVREIIERLYSIEPMLKACMGGKGAGRPGVSFRGIEGGAAGAWMQSGRRAKR